MSADRTPRLVALARSLEMRWRLLRLVDASVDALTATLGASLLVLLADTIFAFDLPAVRLLLVMNGAGLVVAVVRVASRRRDPSHFLIDADRACRLKSLLVSGFEFGREAVGPDADAPAPGLEHTVAFRSIVIDRAETASAAIDASTVYPPYPPRRGGVVAALVVAIGIVAVLSASGWFDPPVPPYAQAALQLEDAGRRLAARSQRSEDLQDLADEIRRLGEQVRDGAMSPEEARRRIDQLGERVEQHLRNLERTPPLAQSEDFGIAPESEDAIRGALESGMSESEVVRFFTKMRSDGITIPDIVEALEEATPDRAADTSLGVDEERLRELLEQLNRRPPDPEAESDIVSDLQESRRALQQMGRGLTEIWEGDDSEAGPSPDGVAGVGRSNDRSDGPDTPGGDGDESSGRQGGTQAVDDVMDDEFRPVEEASPIFREIEGVVTENTVMDIIIRELPSEATSTLTEQEREVIFERVIEEAVNREETPPELRRLVRNYFLRLTFATREGAGNEQ